MAVSQVVMAAWLSRNNSSNPPADAVIVAEYVVLGVDFSMATPAGLSVVALEAYFVPSAGANFLAATLALTFFDVFNDEANLEASDLRFALGFFVAMTWLLVFALLLRCIHKKLNNSVSLSIYLLQCNKDRLSKDGYMAPPKKSTFSYIFSWLWT